MTASPRSGFRIQPPAISAPSSPTGSASCASAPWSRMACRPSPSTAASPWVPRSGVSAGAPSSSPSRCRRTPPSAGRTASTSWRGSRLVSPAWTPASPPRPTPWPPAATTSRPPDSRVTRAPLARTRGLAQPFQCGRSRSDRWSPVTDSLFETPPLDDPGSSTIEHDIMRRRPCANGWLVDVAPARVLPSSSSRLAPRCGRYHGLAAAAIDDPGPIVRSRLVSSRLRKEELRAQTPLTPPPFSWIDHVIRPLEERRRDRQAEGLGGLEADQQLELARLHHRQIARLRALQ